MNYASPVRLNCPGHLVIEHSFVGPSAPLPRSSALPSFSISRVAQHHQGTTEPKAIEPKAIEPNTTVTQGHCNHS